MSARGRTTETLGFVTIAQDALALAYALEVGALDLHDVKSWADSTIAHMITPSDNVLELAVTHDVAEAISLLHVLGSGAPREVVGALVYRYLLQGISAGSLSHELAARAIVRLASESYAPSPDAERESWHFDGAFYLAKNETYGTVAEISAEVEVHLKRYAA
jgi:hypothetical protein